MHQNAEEAAGLIVIGDFLSIPQKGCPWSRAESLSYSLMFEKIVAAQQTINRAGGGNILNPIQVPSDGGKHLDIFGIPMFIRLHGRDTGGALSVMESHDAPGGGPPPHIHSREDETFQVLEGDYQFTVGGQGIFAKPGTTLFAPRGVAHTYRCLDKAPGKLMCVITPSGFEGFFDEIGALTPQQQQDVPRVIEIAKKFGLEILPPAGN